MLEIALIRENPWPEHDWAARALSAARAAVERTPWGRLITDAAVLEISLRLTSDEEVRTLNARYRDKDKPTNVLSFPMIGPDLIATVARARAAPELLLGDIVLAYGVCAAEARERGIALADHATHLIVHGTLHLLGYDHMTDEEAGTMEAIEREALAGLGIADPYLIHED